MKFLAHKTITFSRTSWPARQKLGRDDGGWLMSVALARWLRISELSENPGIDARNANGKTRLELISPEITDAERMKAGVPFEVAASLRDPDT